MKASCARQSASLCCRYWSEAGRRLSEFVYEQMLTFSQTLSGSIRHAFHSNCHGLAPGAWYFLVRRRPPDVLEANETSLLGVPGGISAYLVLQATVNKPDDCSRKLMNEALLLNLDLLLGWEQMVQSCGLDQPRSRGLSRS